MHLQKKIYIYERNFDSLKILCSDESFDSKKKKKNYLIQKMKINSLINMIYNFKK